MEKMKFNLQLFGSGIIDGSSTASNCDCRIVWSSTKNDSNNTSNVTATVQIKKTGSSSTSGTFGGTITIDGTSYPVSKYGSWAWGDWRTVGSASKTVTHNENGTKAINISANLKQTGTSMAGTYTASGTATLDTINRASKLNVIDDFKLTDTITINITKYITTATDKLQIKLGDTLVKEINNITNGYELTFTSSEQTTIKNLMNSPQATLIFLLTTINGETTLGTSTQSATVTSLDKPIYRNVIKKENGHYQVAINGVVDTTINDTLQVYDDEGNYYPNKVLLSTAAYPVANIDYNLSEPISKQKHGIILVFQAYVNGEAKDYDINEFFVSKKSVELLPGKGHSFFLVNSTGAKVATKYIYIHDTKIMGNDVNRNSATKRDSGITTTNNYWVLTYVIGV